MPQPGWGAKRERQYQHIKEGLEKRGDDEDKAQEIAARTVNKERAQAGEARTASRSSVEDMPASSRGGQRPAGERMARVGPCRDHVWRSLGC